MLKLNIIPGLVPWKFLMMAEYSLTVTSYDVIYKYITFLF